MFFTLKNIFICTKLLYDAKFIKIEVLIFKKLLILNDFEVICV